MHLTAEQKNDLRTATLIVLARARQLAFPARVIHSRVIRSALLDYEVTLGQVCDEINTLCQRGLASSIKDPVTDELHYQITPAGLAACPEK
ncbi:hypothetical protein [Geminisphaera colitermitum]|uniref:hypothetical protein n=1 Tax=Geminisphaera colitermitum TaxID=1148786 RepID=UPI000158C725|nr:hypothetical protein [Geminisphaera colitermitum]